jgi:hypothetical protein
MRQSLILLTLFGLLLSCNNNGKTNVLTNTTRDQQGDTISTKSERQNLIKELKRLQAAFASNNKEKIADLFSFPISNEAFGIYIDDSTFNEQLDKNGSKVTRPMFIRSYPVIAESLQINQLNQLFKKLNLDNLLHKDSLEYEAIIKVEPCYYFYGINVENDLVTLTVGTNSNKDYKSKNVSEDEIPENDSSICEHVLWWKFTFDGKKLHFKEISGAG